jgi:hypothetical protein
MRLREFDLDLPDDDAHRFEFRGQTRCITALYERCFPSMTTDKTWKVLVECMKSVKHTGTIDLLGVQVAQVRFDWAEWRRAARLDWDKRGPCCPAYGGIR